MITARLFKTALQSVPLPRRTTPRMPAGTTGVAPLYPEGTGLRLVIKSAKDLAAVRKLAEIKAAN